MFHKKTPGIFIVLKDSVCQTIHSKSEKTKSSMSAIFIWDKLCPTGYCRYFPPSPPSLQKGVPLSRRPVPVRGGAVLPVAAAAVRGPGRPRRLRRRAHLHTARDEVRPEFKRSSLFFEFFFLLKASLSLCVRINRGKSLPDTKERRKEAAGKEEEEDRAASSGSLMEDV